MIDLQQISPILLQQQSPILLDADTEPVDQATYVVDIRIDGPGMDMVVFEDVEPGFEVTDADGLQAGETYQWWIRLDGGAWEDQGTFTFTLAEDIVATPDASLSADYAALLQPQPVALQATPDASGAADHAAQIQPTPATLTASSDLSLGADYAATITEVDAPVVIEASADPSLGADYAASIVAVPVTISVGFDPSLGADFAAFLSDSSASQTVKARISTGERFTSNTSTSERVA